jgi:hypothetical protein
LWCDVHVHLAILAENGQCFLFNFVMWWSSISWYSQIWLLTEYEKKQYYICSYSFGYLLVAYVEIWLFFENWPKNFQNIIGFTKQNVWEW